jgi:hypothetical protein
MTKKTMHAKYRDASEAYPLKVELFGKYADSGRIDARDISAMIQRMLQPFDIHFQKERTVFSQLHSSF